jgi:hypothetical protein
VAPTSARVYNLDAARELRRLVADLGPDLPDPDTVRAIARAAALVGDSSWIAWAADAFDPAHDAVCACRKSAR